MSTLIVIAASGNQFAPNLVKSIPSEHPVLVVETGGETAEGYPMKDRVDGGGCIAAYAHAYRAYRKDFSSFLFLHDSMIVKDPNFLEAFKEKKKEVVAWIGFDMDIDVFQAEYLCRTFGCEVLPELPQKAIFGPIFYATRRAMDALQGHSLLPERSENRNHLTAWERGYAIAFHKAGIEMDFLEEYSNERIDTLKNYKWFSKFRPNRK